MDEKEIKEAFYTAIDVRGIYKELGVNKGAVNHWKDRRGTEKEPSVGLMLEVLLKLGKIRILNNE